MLCYALSERVVSGTVQTDVQSVNSITLDGISPETQRGIIKTRSSIVPRIVNRTTRPSSTGGLSRDELFFKCSDCVALHSVESPLNQTNTVGWRTSLSKHLETVNRPEYRDRHGRSARCTAGGGLETRITQQRKSHSGADCCATPGVLEVTRAATSGTMTTEGMTAMGKCDRR